MLEIKKLNNKGKTFCLPHYYIITFTKINLHHSVLSNNKIVIGAVGAIYQAVIHSQGIR